MMMMSNNTNNSNNNTNMIRCIREGICLISPSIYAVRTHNHSMPSRRTYSLVNSHNINIFLNQKSM